MSWSVSSALTCALFLLLSIYVSPNRAAAKVSGEAAKRSDHCNKTVDIYEDVTSPEVTPETFGRPMTCWYRFRSFRGTPRDWILRIRFKKFKVGTLVNATTCLGGYMQIFLLAFGLSYSYAAPHEDGTEHTHAPIVAPDSESIISVDDDKFTEPHHSDVYLKKSNNTGAPSVTERKAVDDDSDVHHSDTFMMGTEEREETWSAFELVTAHETETTISTTMSRTKDQELVATVVPTPSKNDGKSQSKSVVAHGPMAKNVDEHKKHGHDRQNNEKTEHSIVHHAPMASEHHLTKLSTHNQPTKSNPSAKSDDKNGSVRHAPMATDHSKSLVHHPSLSKSEPATGAHAPFAIPKPHENLTNVAPVTKEEPPTESENTDGASRAPFRIPVIENTSSTNVHRTLLSKLEPSSSYYRRNFLDDGQKSGGEIQYTI